MKVVIQRVTEAAVVVEKETLGEIGLGLVVLVGFGSEDTEDKIKPMAEKIANLRIFPDENGRFEFSLLDISGHVLCVPNFTLYADTSKGRRPEFFAAMQPNVAEKMFRQFVDAFREVGVTEVQQGSFGAYMGVSINNYGPVTIVLDA